MNADQPPPDHSNGKQISPEDAAEIQRRCNELLRDFAAQSEMVQVENPEATDTNRMFISWSILKLASMQLTIQKLADNVQQLKTLIAESRRR